MTALISGTGKTGAPSEIVVVLTLVGRGAACEIARKRARTTVRKLVNILVVVMMVRSRETVYLYDV